jgi:hypothetical protein
MGSLYFRVFTQLVGTIEMLEIMVPASHKTIQSGSDFGGNCWKVISTFLGWQSWRISDFGQVGGEALQ